MCYGSTISMGSTRLVRAPSVKLVVYIVFPYYFDSILLYKMKSQERDAPIIIYERADHNLRTSRGVGPVPPDQLPGGGLKCIVIHVFGKCHCIVVARRRARAVQSEHHRLTCNHSSIYSSSSLRYTTLM